MVMFLSDLRVSEFSSDMLHGANVIVLADSTTRDGEERMRISQKTAALAALGALLLVQVAGAQEKKVKDQAEYDLFNQTLKDANNPAQQIKDLDQWTQKYPDSDYKDDRLDYYIQAYNANKQPDKVLEVGSQLIARDLKQVFKDPKAGPGQILNTLYLMSVNILQIPNPTPDQV